MVKRKHNISSTDVTFENGGKIYYKVMDNSLKHYNYQYNYGLNTLPETYDPERMCGSGGFYVCDLDDLPRWLCLYPDGKIHEVQIPEDARIVSLDNKYKVDKLILGHGLRINEFIKKHKLEEKFIEYLTDNLRYIDRQTPEMCGRMIDRNWESLQFVKKQTKKLCKKAIDYHYSAIGFVKKQTADLCEFALAKNPMAIHHIKRKTKKMYIKAFNADVTNLDKMDQDAKICKLAIECNWRALMYMKPEFITKELYCIGLQQEPTMFKQMSTGLYSSRYQKILEIAMQTNGLDLQYVPYYRLTQQLCYQAVEQNGMALQYVPKNMMSKEMCEMAVKQNGMALQYVPKDMMSKEICDIAAKNNAI